MGKSRFQDNWLKHPEYSKCQMARAKSNKFILAHCRICKCSFDVKAMGESAGKKHADNMKYELRGNLNSDIIQQY